MEKALVFNALRHLLRPLIHFLLRQAVTWKEFTELAKDLYVEVARDSYGLQGRPTNNSRVAMMTGLSRREVAHVRDRMAQRIEDPLERKGNRISRILTAWHVDREFAEDKGRARELPPDGGTGSLSSLLERYAGDLPHGAVIKELKRQGLVEMTTEGTYRALKRDFTYEALDPEILQQMSVSLHDHAATLDHNLNEKRKGPKRFEGIADNARMSPRAVRKFMELVEQRGMDFLTEMDDWLAAHEIEDESKNKDDKIRIGVGLFMIYDDM